MVRSPVVVRPFLASALMALALMMQPAPAFAQKPDDTSRARIAASTPTRAGEGARALSGETLRLPASAPPGDLVVMNLAAHPDDEDGLTLTTYRFAHNAVAHSVVFTRGEGGQNEIGPDLYERLGAVRTNETEAAARHLGTQVHFLNLYDFGFSKSAAESFAAWSTPRRGFWNPETPIKPERSVEAGRERVVAALVRIIRETRPDVLFTNHDTVTVWPQAQHGHHQAVGLAAWEAFDKAADPTYHPEHFEAPGVGPWQPKRLFVRVGIFETAPKEVDVRVPVSVPCPNPVRVLTAGEDSDAEPPTCADRAVAAAAQHRSQGFDKFAERFRRDTTAFVLYRAAPGVTPLPSGATDLAAGLDRETPVHQKLSTQIAGRRIAPLPGLTVSDPGAVPGQAVVLTWPVPDSVQVDTRTIAADEARLRVPSLKAEAPLAAGELSITVPADGPLTHPPHRAQYDRELGTPPFPYELVTERAGATRRLAASFVPLGVMPPVTIDLAPGPIRLTPGPNHIPVTIRTADPVSSAVSVTVSILPQSPGDNGRSPEPLAREIVMLAPADTTAELSLRLPLTTPPGRYRVVAEGAATPTLLESKPTRVERPAAVLPDVSVPDGLRVGFVESVDGTMAEAMRVMGAEVTPLDSTDLATGDLSRFETIVLDIRAYLTRPDLRVHNDRLLNWVRDGGHLVVGYQKLFEWNPGRTVLEALGENPAEGFAPYPLTLGRKRVTMEKAPVTLFRPDHVLFQQPHAITAADWESWVQERGLYFPETIAPEYERLIAVSDDGEEPLEGGLLLAQVERGTYLYSPLVWYRQLEALNPGAWRLFANLVSLPRTRPASHLGDG